MPRRQAPLTPLELEIMKVLWDLGPASVQAVQQRLPGEPLAYTTVQTMLNVLLDKGKVKRSLKNRAFLYRPALSRVEAVRQTMKDLIDRMFDGSAEALVMGLVETRQLSPEKLDELRRRLEAERDK
jgi:predicted transcriptional regulator